MEINLALNTDKPNDLAALVALFGHLTNQVAGTPAGPANTPTGKAGKANKDASKDVKGETKIEPAAGNANSGDDALDKEKVAKTLALLVTKEKKAALRAYLDELQIESVSKIADDDMDNLTKVYNKMKELIA